MAAKALEGVRVLENGVVWAIPHCCMILANMGAEVIKVEAIQYIERARGSIKFVPLPGVVPAFPQRNSGERPWDRFPYWNSTNQSKYGITLDLTRPRGTEIYRRLVEKSDVVIEGYAHGVFKKMGLGYEVLKGWKPDIIYASAPALGAGGPESDYVGYGTNQWHMAGMASVTGYPGEGPMQAGFTYCDPTAGCHVAGFVVAALLYRRRTGKGLFLDVSQTEPNLGTLGEVILDYTMNGRMAPQLGNGHPFMAPHGCYRCQGDDMWVTIAVGSDEEWWAFRQALGDPPWASEEKFATTLGRWQNQGELNRHIEEWTSQRDRYQVTYLLQSVGVAAAPVLRVEDVFDNAQMKARNYYVPVDNPESGIYPHRNVGYRMSQTPGAISRHAPSLGQHNSYVFGELLGMPQEEMADLEREQYIGTIPLPGADGIGRVKKSRSSSS